MDPRRALLQYLADLGEAAGEWEELSEQEIDSWVYDWPNEVAGPLALQRSYEAGEMDPEKRAFYEQVRAKLAAMAPALERIGLLCPRSS